MSTPSYPIQLQLARRPVLVAGAGAVATRKIERLVECGAAVSVVARAASQTVLRLAREQKLSLALRDVEVADAQGKLLVIAATDDPRVNARLAAAARAAGALSSRVDAPDDSDFTLPALARGDFVLATVSTHGAAPSASRRLGRELKRWVSAGPDRFVAEVAKVRSALRGRDDAARRLRELGESELFEACQRRDEARISALVQQALGEPS